MKDLSTTYMGMKLKNPVVASASPMSENLDLVKRLEDAGAAAVVLGSLFEEQITLESQHLDQFLTGSSNSYAEALDYFPEMDDYKLGPEAYLDHVRACKRSLSIPVIASLNGVSSGGWIRYAKLMEEAGADALELNIYYIPTDPSMDALKVEQMYVNLVRDIRAQVSFPIAVKLNPYFSALVNTAQVLEGAGADALVLFNRFYQPDFDLETLEIVPDLKLSRSSELLLRLRWIAILFGRIRADMGVTGGVHTSEDVLKAMMAGARVAMMTSALLKSGPERVTEILNAVNAWMEEHEYASIKQMQGSMSQLSVAEPTAFERANYMKVLSSYVMEDFS